MTANIDGKDGGKDDDDDDVDAEDEKGEEEEKKLLSRSQNTTCFICTCLFLQLQRILSVRYLFSEEHV
jgi:hypothetical protein